MGSRMKPFNLSIVALSKKGQIREATKSTALFDGAQTRTLEEGDLFTICSIASTKVEVFPIFTVSKRINDNESEYNLFLGDRA